MNKRTLRLWLKWSLPANLVLFALAVADYVLWDSAAIIPILAVYSLFLVGVLVLVILDETPHYQRLEFAPRSEGPKTIIYGRR